MSRLGEFSIESDMLVSISLSFLKYPAWIRARFIC